MERVAEGPHPRPPKRSRNFICTPLPSLLTIFIKEMRQTHAIIHTNCMMSSPGVAWSEVSLHSLAQPLFPLPRDGLNAVMSTCIRLTGTGRPHSKLIFVQDSRSLRKGHCIVVLYLCSNLPMIYSSSCNARCPGRTLD